MAISGAARKTDEFALELGDRRMRVRAGVDVAVGQIRRRFVVLVGVGQPGEGQRRRRWWFDIPQRQRHFDFVDSARDFNAFFAFPDLRRKRKADEGVKNNRLMDFGNRFLNSDENETD